MFKFFKKKKDTEVDKTESFEIELTATILAYGIGIFLASSYITSN